MNAATAQFHTQRGFALSGSASLSRIMTLGAANTRLIPRGSLALSGGASLLCSMTPSNYSTNTTLETGTARQSDGHIHEG